MRWQAGRPGPAVLAMLTGWVALISWQGMLAEPSGYLVNTLLGGLLVVLAGSGLRALGRPAYAVVLTQVLLAALVLNTLFAAGQSLLGVLPTEASVRQVVYALGNGAGTLNTYVAPVEVNPTYTRAVLSACGLLVVLAVDVLAMTLRRPALVAVPLLVTLGVPITILDTPLALPVFVVVASLFLRLLVTERSWTATRVLWQVSVAALLVAVLAAPLVPVTDLLDRSDSAAAGNGSGKLQLAAVDPLIRMRRDLVEKTNTPLVYAETKARSTSYLRTTVLDRFTSDEWRPSSRELPAENTADGVFPRPPGLAPGTATTEDRWSLQLAPGVTTTWLPIPAPIRDLAIAGRWRFESRTLDVTFVGDTVPAPGLRYRATSLVPRITAEALSTAVPPPASLRTSMTEVPEDLPTVIRRRAREVTRGASTDFAKAVAIQDWFRQDGGFRYSLQRRSGTGMDLLAAFVTDDRVGYCEQFATAMATMGRTLGIASRVSVGFLSGTKQPDGRILYTSDDRHAWPEMYFSGVGWVRFEPTPGQRTGASPAWTRQPTGAAALPTAPSASASPRSAPTPEPAPADSSTGVDQGLEVPWWPAGLVLGVAALVLAPGLVRRAQRRRRLSPEDPTHLAEGAWAELHATAVDLGLDWPESRTPREQARSVVGQVRAGAEDVGALEDLLGRVERGRYARPGVAGPVEAGTRSATVHAVGAWRQVMTDSARSVPAAPRGRWWRRVWPASLLRRS